MDYFYDVAFALANRSLCLFTGAGFSKQISGDTMPGWKELLQSLCDYLENPHAAQVQLEECLLGGLPLEDCAHVMEMMFLKERKDLRESIAARIRKCAIKPSPAAAVTAFLQNHRSVRIISTNYDDLIQRYILPDQCNSNYPGKAITQRDGRLAIYQIHGSVEHPPSIVATTEDYYRFINSPTYFSRKIYTLMAENTTVFLGYALGDSNLKAIIHAFRSSAPGPLSRGSLFYVTRSKIPQYLKDHYEASFGLFVIDQLTIDDFLNGVRKALPEAEAQVERAEDQLRKVLAGTHHYNDKYLHSTKSLAHIVSVANKTGQDISSRQFMQLFSDLLVKKVAFTTEPSAWDQYAQLAEWLVYIGSLINICGTPLEEPYLAAVTHSMKTMSGSRRWGRSWEAFTIWQTNWGNIMFHNRQRIGEHVRRELPREPDALKVIADS